MLTDSMMSCCITTNPSFYSWLGGFRRGCWKFADGSRRLSSRASAPARCGRGRRPRPGPAAVGIVGSVAVAVLVGLAVHRVRAPRPTAWSFCCSGPATGLLASPVLGGPWPGPLEFFFVVRRLGGAVCRANQLSFDWGLGLEGGPPMRSLVAVLTSSPEQRQPWSFGPRHRRRQVAYRPPTSVEGDSFGCGRCCARGRQVAAWRCCADASIAGTMSRPPKLRPSLRLSQPRLPVKLREERTASSEPIVARSSCSPHH